MACFPAARGYCSMAYQPPSSPLLLCSLRLGKGQNLPASPDFALLEERLLAVETVMSARDLLVPDKVTHLDVSVQDFL